MAIANCTDGDVNFRTEPPVRDDDESVASPPNDFRPLLAGHFNNADLSHVREVIFRDVNWELRVFVPDGDAKVVLARQPIDILLPQGS